MHSKNDFVNGSLKSESIHKPLTTFALVFYQMHNFHLPLFSAVLIYFVLAQVEIWSIMGFLHCGGSQSLTSTIDEGYIDVQVGILGNNSVF